MLSSFMAMWMAMKIEGNTTTFTFIFSSPQTLLDNTPCRAVMLSWLPSESRQLKTITSDVNSSQVQSGLL